MDSDEDDDGNFKDEMEFDEKPYQPSSLSADEDEDGEDELDKFMAGIEVKEALPTYSYLKYDILT